MKYVLVWCSRLSVFAIHCPGLSSRTFSESELRSEFAGNGVLVEWLEFSKSNPNVECVYDMLPN